LRLAILASGPTAGYPVPSLAVGGASTMMPAPMLDLAVTGRRQAWFDGVLQVPRLAGTLRE